MKQKNNNDNGGKSPPPPVSTPLVSRSIPMNTLPEY